MAVIQDITGLVVLPVSTNLHDRLCHEAVGAVLTALAQDFEDIAVIEQIKDLSSSIALALVHKKNYLLDLSKLLLLISGYPDEWDQQTRFALKNLHSALKNVQEEKTNV